MFCDLQADGVIDCCGKCDEGEEAPVPPAVEEVGGGEEEEVLGLEACAGARPPVEDPVCREDEREEQEEFDGVEEHGFGRLRGNRFWVSVGARLRVILGSVCSRVVAKLPASG